MPIEPYAHIQARATTAASVEDVWNLLTGWPAQSRWIPFTHVANDNDHTGVGARFTGRTQLGPFWFDDPLEVTVWEPPVGQDPGYCKVRKFGPWILGTAKIGVTTSQVASHETTVTWSELVRLRGVPAFFNPLVRAAGGVLFRATIRKAIRELESR